MKGDNGFIFVVTLLMIMVISLLLLVSMQHILLYYKIINIEEESHKNFYRLEHVTRKLAQKYRASPILTCVNQDDSPDKILHKLLHHQGCSLTSKGLQYDYFIEDLGEFPCLVALEMNQRYATHHYRLSIVQFDKEIPLSFLQVRLVALGGRVPCFSKEHIIPLGTSSWRYLASPLRS